MAPFTAAERLTPDNSWVEAVHLQVQRVAQVEMDALGLDDLLNAGCWAPPPQERKQHGPFLEPPRSLI